MKKVQSAVAVLVLCFIMVLNFSACGFKHPIEKLLDKLDEENYKMEIEAWMFTIEREFDGNIMHEIIPISGERYILDEGNIRYTYTKNIDGEWQVEESEIESSEDTFNVSDLIGSDAFSSDFLDILDPDCWEKVKKNKYELADDDLDDIFEDAPIREVTLTIDDDEYVFEFELNADGINVEATVTLSEFGEIDLDLPHVEDQN